MAKLVCIDSGHGGSDPGACGGAAQEKHIALKIALKLDELLAQNGIGTIMTRKTDVFDTPKKKAEKANLSKADLFVSIHCNAASDQRANGTETLSYDMNGESGKLAKSIQTSLVQATGLSDRGVKERKEIIVLNSTNMPAVLVEIAFISNKEERLLLLSEKFQFEAAKAICRGICNYIGINAKVEEKKISIDEAKKLVKEKCAFDDNTMMYLGFYKYSDALIMRIAEKIN